MPTKIFVGNLEVESSPEYERELSGLFEQFGKVTECSILTGKSFGFVHMENEEEAKIAIAALNGHEFEGSQLNVEMSPNQGDRRGGGGRGRGGRDFGGRGGGRGRGRGGFDRDRGGGRGRGRGGKDYGRDGGRDRYDPYARKSRYSEDSYDSYGGSSRRAARDPYADDPYLRDPYARDPYADPYLRDPYARDPYSRDPYARDPYAARDAYARPPPDYYARSRDPYEASARREAYAYERGSREDELVAYPPPRGANGYGKDVYG